MGVIGPDGILRAWPGGPPEEVVVRAAQTAHLRDPSVHPWYPTPISLDSPRRSPEELAAQEAASAAHRAETEAAIRDALAELADLGNPGASPRVFTTVLDQPVIHGWAWPLGLRLWRQRESRMATERIGLASGVDLTGRVVPMTELRGHLVRGGWGLHGRKAARTAWTPWTRPLDGDRWPTVPGHFGELRTPDPVSPYGTPLLGSRARSASSVTGTERLAVLLGARDRALGRDTPQARRYPEPVLSEQRYDSGGPQWHRPHDVLWEDLEVVAARVRAGAVSTGALDLTAGPPGVVLRA